jgi:hypothetical protein
MMANFFRIIRPLVQCASVLCVLLFDATPILRLCRRSPAAVATESLFLRKQFVLYQERNIKPSRPDTLLRMAIMVCGLSRVLVGGASQR